MRNQYGLANPFAVTHMSLHSANPGVGASPAAGELTAAPYARQASTFGAPANVSGVATATSATDAVFDLVLEGNLNVGFVGLWDGATYAGYMVADPTGVYTGTATTRSYTVEAGTTITSSNPT